MRRAAVVAGVVAAVGAAVVLWVVPGGDSEPAAAGAGDGLEPATPQGLAAAVHSHLPGADLKRVEDSSGDDAGGDGPELRVDLVYRVDGSAVRFSAGATEELTEWEGVEDICDKSTGANTCEVTSTEDGSRMAVLHIADPPAKGRGFSMVVLHRGDQIVFVTESPRKPTPLDELPVPLATLEAIVSDRLVGISTSPGMNTTGQELPFRA